ncbi:MAG TPA: SMP-30/gluconolactonase/LRE family protein [Mycobacteriales bacterium]|jgi:sugar lactone lactonase YvrE|nr:SMP-30/gluconolactonase/LRE family protein [Mycobacteriales bacterium]
MARPAISPVVWQPPQSPARAREPRSARALPPLTVLDVLGRGPEDVLFDAEGRVLCGVSDGRILRLTPDGRTVEVLANTGGRPLGLEWLPDGALLVCDARLGLLRVTLSTGAVETLADGFSFCNNAAVAPDGTIYFSDSTGRLGIDHWKGELLQHSGSGRLLRRGLGSEITTLLDGLEFANGVALAPDGTFVVVAETGAYRLMRWSVDDGTSSVLVDNLPGFPDNVSTGSDGLFWVAIGSPRDASLDRLLPLRPALRKAVWALPDRFQPRPKHTVWVQAYAPDGRLVHDLQAPGGEFGFVTGVREKDGRVALGSLTGGHLAQFSL